MRTTSLAIPLPVPDELCADQSYGAILQRLSEMSVKKAHDPYLDIPWSAPESAIEPGDPRLCIDPRHPLAQTAWYEQLDADTRARFGTEWLAQSLKYAIGMEAVLSRGLLMFAQTVGNRSPEYRYVMHEVVEESRHSQMFQELLDRLDADPVPVAAAERFFDDRVANTARYFPELFLISVLGGEIFIDRQNRDELRRPKSEVHPLIRRILQIHVTEEARHVCFAEQYLKKHLPYIGARKRATLKALAPILLWSPARMMLVPSPRLVRQFAIPQTALDQAFGAGSEHRKLLARTVEPIRVLAAEHGFWWPAAWRRFGLATARVSEERRSTS
jgi:hypothetical protein